MSEKIRIMFASIAHKYDLLNDILSFGIHKKWRKKAVCLSQAENHHKVLDCACGTGDFSFEFAKISNYVVGSDFCVEMLEIAQKKAANYGYSIDFVQADAMDLPFDDNSFDIVSIAFGIRNVDSVEKAINEMARVLKPNGKLVILEFGQPQGFIKFFYNFYSRNIMPAIGRIIAKSESAYTYLPETAAQFPCAESFIDIARQSYDFKNATYSKLNGGIAFIYILEK